jgi:hypothetical protein
MRAGVTIQAMCTFLTSTGKDVGFLSTKKRLSKFLNFVILLQLIVASMQVPLYF